MIIIITLIVLALLASVLFIIGKITDDWNSEYWYIGGGISELFIGFSLFICGIICIVHNSPSYNNAIRIKLNEEIAEIENTRKALEYKIESDTLTILEINTYNEKVSGFKSKIKTEQMYLRNPWINWFSSYVYNEFNPDVVSYL